MDATFCAEPAERIAATDLQHHAAIAGTFTLGGVHDLGCETMSLGPSHVGAQQNRSPVTRLGAAGSCLNGDDGVGVGILATKEERGAGFLEVALKERRLRCHLVLQPLVTL